MTQIRPRLFLLTGGGGNTLALVTTSGVVLVDTKMGDSGPGLLDQLRTVTNQPVTTIVNTHAHADHVQGNRFFAASRTIASHSNARATMRELPFFPGEDGRGLPNTTFERTLSLRSGDDEVVLRHYGPAHTNGDTVVVFPDLGVAHTGDLFPGKVPPIIVRLQGGSGLAYPETLARAAADLSGIDTIITGHGAGLMTTADLEEYARAVGHMRDWTVEQWQAKRPAKDAAFAYRIPEEYAGYTDEWRVTTDVQLIYDELNHAPPRPLRPWWKFW